MKNTVLLTTICVIGHAVHAAEHSVSLPVTEAHERLIVALWEGDISVVAGSDDAIKLTPPTEMTLDAAIEYIQDDEYVEVTPNTIRLCKKLLSKTDRKRLARKERNGALS